MPIEDIKNVFESTGETYQRMLNRFRPCKPGSEFLEQNLVTLFCHEFINRFGPEACAFSEVPFLSSQSDSHWSSRLDCFLIEGNNGYLLEAKGSNSKSLLLQSIDEDLRRIHSEELHSSLEIMATERGHDLPENLYGLVISDMWTNEKITFESSNPLADLISQSPSFSYIDRITTLLKPMGLYDGYRHYLFAGWTNRINL